MKVDMTLKQRKKPYFSTMFKFKEEGICNFTSENLYFYSLGLSIISSHRADYNTATEFIISRSILHTDVLEFKLGCREMSKSTYDCEEHLR